MHFFIEFIGKWADTIGKVFGEFPIAAAIVTLAAALAFFAFVKWPIQDWMHATLVFFGVFICWLICVPLLGWVFRAVGFLSAASAFMYERYERQPLVFLATTALALVGGLIWVYALPRRGPPRIQKILAIAGCWLLGILLLVPIFDVFAPTKDKTASGAKTETAKEKPKQPTP